MQELKDLFKLEESELKTSATQTQLAQLGVGQHPDATAHLADHMQALQRLPGVAGVRCACFVLRTSSAAQHEHAHAWHLTLCSLCTSCLEWQITAVHAVLGWHARLGCWTNLLPQHANMAIQAWLLTHCRDVHSRG